MAKKKRKPYLREFREEVLRLVETSDKSIAEIERELGLSEGLVQKWRERYVLKQRRTQAQSNNSDASERTIEEAEAEIRELKRELETVKQERDILKKAISVFSKDDQP